MNANLMKKEQSAPAQGNWRTNPFVQRLRSINDKNLLKRLLVAEPNPLVGLDALSPDVAADQFEKWLAESQYAPTEESLDLALYILSVGESHAISAYPDRATFISQSSSSSIQAPLEPTTRLFTGYAGIGKTAQLTALIRVLNAEQPVYQPSVQCPPRKILGGLFITIRSKTPKAEAVGQIVSALGIEFKSGVVNERILQTVRIEMYRQGVMFIIADEVQTQGGNSSTGATFVNFVGFLRTLGVPVIFVGNFSMCHVMLKNHSQNIQRLLVDPLIALPDNHESPDYIQRLRRYKEACMGILEIDPDRDGPQLCEWTFGINRTFVKLAALAYKMARKDSKKSQVVIDMQRLRQAYDSKGFSALRDEVRQLTNWLLLEKKPSKKDLICPFEVAGKAADELEASRKRLLRQELAKSKLASGLVPADKAAIKQGSAEAPSVVASTVQVLLHGPNSEKADAPKSDVNVVDPLQKPRRQSRRMPTSADALRWGNPT